MERKRREDENEKQRQLRSYFIKQNELSDQLYRDREIKRQRKKKKRENNYKIKEKEKIIKI